MLVGENGSLLPAMHPTRVGCPIRETAKGQLCTLGISGELDHMIAETSVSGGDLCQISCSIW
jgi:hypothetical protein